MEPGQTRLRSTRKATHEFKVESFYCKVQHHDCVMKMANCAKCGKEVEAGKEVKKGWIGKKTYHAECAK